MNVSKALSRHHAAITMGNVTKTNVIGLRKLFNAAARLEAGHDARENVNGAQIAVLRDALALHEPWVAGELVASGLKLLSSPRWRKRFNDAEQAVIADLDGFKLVRFDWIDSLHVTPVYRACGRNGGSFLFRNLPWQMVAYMEREDMPSGPEVQKESGK
jgi:hypothetical protein